MTSSSMDTDNLPPKRTSPSMRNVSKPLESTRLNRLIYLLLLLSTLLSAYYGYRVLQWKTEVGGWWNLALGKRPPPHRFDMDRTSSKYASPKGRGRGKHEEVEDRINALADALGMPKKDLASAIAGAVKAYVPPASLSSVAAHQTGEAVDALLKGVDKKEDAEPEPQQDAEAAGGVGGMMGTFVGMDEP
ncbi:hypothetical protein B0H15DRAFT_917046 [Mycena belliarum]|uniref:Uncharacterized protein n=1 Tax=Mycena belliarum TaxID=1033014 RepID=A0AAD6TU38_9AGAR|nr:hypothetical protein B0H15DRAFT_917046 [Mycena belliae]